MLHLAKQTVKKILMYFFSKFPVQKKVVFINFNGRGFGCNPKYIALEMLAEKIPYELVWLVSDLNESFPNGIRKVSFGSIYSFYELATAKVIITNVLNTLPFIKKENQIMIQTWHGSFSPKLLEHDAKEYLSADYLKASLHSVQYTDLFLSNSQIQTKEYQRAFRYQGDILECGYPRNDILVNATPDLKNKIKDRLGISHDTKVIFYMPTFRGDGNLSPYKLNAEKIREIVEKKLGGKWIMGVRLHPNIANMQAPIEFSSTVRDFTRYPDCQDLLLITDILITDYSTTMFDLLLLDKPVFLFATDIEHYQKDIRGLKPMYYSLPFPLARSNQELCDLLHDVDWNKLMLDIQLYKQEYGGFDHGNAAKAVCHWLKERINNET